jgi:hypothetical protein
VYTSSGSTPIIFSIVVLITGLAAFFAWAKAEKQWPFGPKEIREEFLRDAEREQRPRQAVPA